MIRASRKWTIAAALIAFGLSVQTLCAAGPSRVLVIGTIHDMHGKNPNYLYQHLLDMLAGFAPDVLCVEIRPQDFRKQSYLKEMMMATIFGRNRGLKVYPVDWWTDDGGRAQRAAYMATPEYKAKEKEENDLIAKNVSMQTFIKTYGDLDEIWKKNEAGYEFYNGAAYNRYVEEMYKVSMAVYGDGPMNLFYKTRNDKMMDLIKQALAENSGRRIVVLTGAEHKHYFDRALTGLPGVEVSNLADILPLHPAPPDPSIARFVADNLAKGYFDESEPGGVDMLYMGALMPLVHGPNMDFFPEKIPLQNLPKAKALIAEWHSASPNSVLTRYEAGWVDFLAAEYRPAITHFENILDRLDVIPESYRDFVKRTIDRNLGLCHDLLGERDKAVACYQRGLDACKATAAPEFLVKALFRDFVTHPFRRRP